LRVKVARDDAKLLERTRIRDTVATELPDVRIVTTIEVVGGFVLSAAVNAHLCSSAGTGLRVGGVVRHAGRDRQQLICIAIDRGQIFNALLVNRGCNLRTTSVDGRSIGTHGDGLLYRPGLQRKGRVDILVSVQMDSLLRLRLEAF